MTATAERWVVREHPLTRLYWTGNTFLGDGMARLAAFIRRCERDHRRVARNARRVGQGARRALRRRQRGEARRLATRYVRDIQRRESFGVARVPRPAGWAHNMARAASIAQLLAATWNFVPLDRRGAR